MAKSNGGTAERVRAIIEKTVIDNGCCIWDVEYVREGADWYLRVTIDRDEGVDLDCCEKVHRAIDPVLDEADPIEDAYYLQVSSPGLERTIRLPEHYYACVGEKVQVKLYKPFEGKKVLTGILSVNEDCSEITIENNGQTVSLPRAAIAKANVLFEF